MINTPLFHATNMLAAIRGRVPTWPGYSGSGYGDGYGDGDGDGDGDGYGYGYGYGDGDGDGYGYGYGDDDTVEVLVPMSRVVHLIKCDPAKWEGKL